MTCEGCAFEKAVDHQACETCIYKPLNDTRGMTCIHKGRWCLRCDQNDKCLRVLPKETNQMGAIVSDGGSTPSMYQFELEAKGQKLVVETGDVIRCMFGNDFDYGNIVKALRRLYMASLGMGKSGNTSQYEIEKIKYFLAQLEEQDNERMDVPRPY